MDKFTLMLNWLFNSAIDIFNFYKSNMIFSFVLSLVIFKYVVEFFNKIKKIF